MIFDFWFSSDPPVVISVGNKPGAMELTLIRSGTKVYAHSLVKCKKAALLDEYANWPREFVFVIPAVLEMLMMELEWPGIDSRPLLSKGSSAAVRKWWAATLPAYDSRQASVPSRTIHLPTAWASEKSISPAWLLARISGETPALLIKMLIPLSSALSSSDAMALMPSVWEISPGRL